VEIKIKCFSSKYKVVKSSSFTRFETSNNFDRKNFQKRYRIYESTSNYEKKEKNNVHQVAWEEDETDFILALTNLGQ